MRQLQLYYLFTSARIWHAGYGSRGTWVGATRCRGLWKTWGAWVSGKHGWCGCLENTTALNDQPTTDWRTDRSIISSLIILTDWFIDSRMKTFVEFALTIKTKKIWSEFAVAKGLQSTPIRAVYCGGFIFPVDMNASCVSTKWKSRNMALSLWGSGPIRVNCSHLWISSLCSLSMSCKQSSCCWSSWLQCQTGVSVWCASRSSCFVWQSFFWFCTAVMDTSTSNTAKYNGWLISANGVSPVMTKNQLTNEKTEHSHVTSWSKNQIWRFFTRRSPHYTREFNKAPITGHLDLNLKKPVKEITWLTWLHCFRKKFSFQNDFRQH